MSLDYEEITNILYDGMDEQEGILISHLEETKINAWLRFDNEHEQWLEISYRPGDHPALKVSIIDCSEKELLNHIHKEFNDGNWLLRKSCIDGIKVDDEQIIRME